MKLKLHLGETALVELVWWQKVEDLPHLATYKGEKFAFAMWLPDDSRQHDYICIFETVQFYDPNYYATTYVPIERFLSSTKCECGAIYTSFPQIHMFFCPKWTKKI